MRRVRRPGNKHGYGNYTLGCRCDVCTAAKAAYIRERRAAATREAQQHTAGRPGEVGTVRYVAPVRKHGTSYAYYERGCRCHACTDYARQWGGDAIKKRRMSPERPALAEAAG